MTRAPLAELSLVGICAIWGLTFPVVQDAVTELPVTTFLAYRFVGAAVLAAILFRRQLRALPADGWRAGALMGLFLTGGYLLQTLGLERTTASNAGFITGLFVVLTPLFAAIFLGHRAGGTAWAAAGVAAVGLYLLSGSGGGLNIVGDLLVLGCAMSFSFHILVTDPAVKRYDVSALLVVQLAVCGAISLLLSVGQGQMVLPREQSVWSALAITAVLASVLGFYVQAYAQRHASPSRTALILASEPAFAGLFAWLLKGQSLTGLGWVGAALIMAAIVSVQLVPYLRPSRPLPEG
ncbi:MAG TPA: DMT family transporter [Actinomycetota bacterium]|nr:DMT family transporter [Actinomycetota bacterium]